MNFEKRSMKGDAKKDATEKIAEYTVAMHP
jgi:hypothetical protein